MDKRQDQWLHAFESWHVLCINFFFFLKIDQEPWSDIFFLNSKKKKKKNQDDHRENARANIKSA